MKEYTLSRYLNIIERKDGIAIYHSLFGGLLITDDKGIEVLRKFHNPTKIQKVRELYFYKSDFDKFIDIMKKRFFIVDKDVDEYESVKAEKMRRLANIRSGEFIDSIQLIVSNRCNFDCEYCFLKTMYSSKIRAELQKSQENQIMTYEMAKEGIDKLIEMAKRNKITYITVEFFGGEPMCNFELIEKILDEYKNGRGRGIGILYSMVTNASLITEEAAKKLAEYQVHTALSFDSPGTDNRLLGEKDELQNMIQEKVNMLNRYGATIIINSALTRHNIDDFNPVGLMDFMVKNSINKLVLTQELDIEFYESDKNINKMIKKTLKIIEEAAKHQISVNGTWAEIFNQINRNTPINMVRGCKSCAGCSSKLSLEPCGEVFACKSTSANFGNIKNGEEIFESENYRSFVERGYDNCEQCRGCCIEGMCSGLCVGSIEKKYGDVFHIEDRACRMFKEITRRLIETVDRKKIDYLPFVRKE